jgi:hypothetical protein
LIFPVGHHEKVIFSFLYFGIISQTYERITIKRRKQRKKFILACNEVVFDSNQRESETFECSIIGIINSHLKKSLFFLSFLTPLPPFLSLFLRLPKSGSDDNEISPLAITNSKAMLLRYTTIL